MGLGVRCRCGFTNGPLADLCLKCLGDLALPSDCRRGRNGGPFAWETVDLSQVYPTAPFEETVERVSVDLHALLRYRLLLAGLLRWLERLDTASSGPIDEIVSFLRGGWPFAEHVNLNYVARRRMRIFGGLNHARRPSRVFQDWFGVLVKRARDVGLERLDIALIDEAYSGSGLGRIWKLLTEAAARQPNMGRVEVRLHFAAVIPEDAANRPQVLKKTQRPPMTAKGISLIPEFTLLYGPVLFYDDPKFLGLDRVSGGDFEQEDYRIVKWRASLFSMTCPVTRQAIWNGGTIGEGDAPSFISSFVSLGLSHDRPEIDQLARGLVSEGCPDCRRLLALVNEEGQP